MDKLCESSSDLLRSFGRHIRDLRRGRGLSQEDFAELCGLDRTYVGGVERGERNISLKNIGKIALALDLSVARLLEEV
jgi:transcriptional regulator with XRE-family HTH domain